MTLAFFGFLRIGELTCDSHFNPERHLSFSDLVFMPKSSPRYMLVQLKVSKTDLFRKGQIIVTGKANSHFCPLSAMLAYLESRTPFPTTGPLFTFQSGSFLNRGRLTNETRLLLSKEGLNSGEFAGHSFRIGAATTAASANLPPWIIKVLERRSSDCFERYIKTPPSVLAQVPQTLTELLWCLLFLSVEIFLFYCGLSMGGCFAFVGMKCSSRHTFASIDSTFCTPGMYV